MPKRIYYLHNTFVYLIFKTSISLLQQKRQRYTCISFYICLRKVPMYRKPIMPSAIFKYLKFFDKLYKLKYTMDLLSGPLQTSQSEYFIPRSCNIKSGSTVKMSILLYLLQVLKDISYLKRKNIYIEKKIKVLSRFNI